jgi:hypothetical protein
MSKQRKLPGWLALAGSSSTKNGDLKRETRFVAPVMYVMNVKELKEIANIILNEEEENRMCNEETRSENTEAQEESENSSDDSSHVSFVQCNSGITGESFFADRSSVQEENTDSHSVENNKSVINVEHQDEERKPDLSILDIFFKKS